MANHVKLDWNGNAMINLFNLYDQHFINGDCRDFDFVKNSLTETHYILRNLMYHFVTLSV